MVEDSITDGRRIAELLSSELSGREDGELERFAVTNADRDVEPSVDGARAYDVEYDEYDDGCLARVYVQPDRVRLELEVGRAAATEAATDAELRVRPKATTPPKTLVFVENGAEVKRATDVLEAVAGTIGTNDLE